jgi:hypothetical protein
MLKEKVEYFINNALKPIKDAIEGWVEGVLLSFKPGFVEYQSTGTVSDENIYGIFEAILGPFADILLGLGETLSIIFDILSPFFSAIQKLIDIIADLLSNLISKAIGAITGEDYSSFFEGISFSNPVGLLDGVKSLFGVNTPDFIQDVFTYLSLPVASISYLLFQLGFLTGLPGQFVAFIGIIVAIMGVAMLGFVKAAQTYTDEYWDNFFEFVGIVWGTGTSVIGLLASLYGGAISGEPIGIILGIVGAAIALAGLYRGAILYSEFEIGVVESG